MPRAKSTKQKKLTVSELKKKMEVGTVLTMIDFHGQQVNKRRVVVSLHSKFVKMSGDGIKDGEFSYLNWPKAAELSATEDGFLIDAKYGALRYIWGEVKADEPDNTTSNV